MQGRGLAPEPYQEVLRSIYIRVAGVATLPAAETLPVPVPLPDVAAFVAPLTGVGRWNLLESNTVRLAGHFQPVKPVTVCPRTETTSHIFRHATLCLPSMRKERKILGDQHRGICGD